MNGCRPVVRCVGSIRDSGKTALIRTFPSAFRCLRSIEIWVSPPGALTTTELL